MKCREVNIEPCTMCRSGLGFGDGTCILSTCLAAIDSDLLGEDIKAKIIRVVHAARDPIVMGAAPDLVNVYRKALKMRCPEWVEYFDKMLVLA